MTERKSVPETPGAAFSGMGLHPQLVRGVEDLGFIRPTPVQAEAIPPGVQGRDVLACAMTGSGKTAAFLLPILHRLMDKPRGVTRALILAPTRELAAQIYQHLQELGKHTGIRGAAVFGGVGMAPQEQAFRRGVDILIATPGRLLDHFQYPYARLDSLEVLVLDEADRMLDMGFLPDIRRVLKHLPRTPRQTLFFSATLPPPIVELTRELLSSPAAINVARKQAPPSAITQAVFPVAENLKTELLLELFRRDEVSNAIVFCRTKHRVNRLTEKLERSGISVTRIHGNRSQTRRTEALAGFKSGEFRVLVATDIVGRGIDVEALEHVVNFDVPKVPEDYIHRVGRTGRVEAIGEAYTFVSPDEEGDLRDIERALGKRLERRTLSGFDYTRKHDGPLEIPLKDRIAEIRARKSEERARAAAKAERKAQGQGQPAAPAGRGGYGDRKPQPQRDDRPRTHGTPERGARPEYRTGPHHDGGAPRDGGGSRGRQGGRGGGRGNAYARD
ncbi:MAG TPA: DEAD/DEAH box helicase [Longimicrobiaceae bacterium]|nr:DEAD/DEAH box helicase [Longimicrobiaceae bacterium]